MVRAFLVDSHLRNILVKVFQNLSIDIAEEVVKSLFLFTDGRTTDDRQRLITIAHHEGLVLR